MSALRQPFVIGIAGWKNSGKTTLTTRLIAECKRRGITVGSIKHSHHAIDLDDGETDSARHRRAGADQVAIAGPNRYALITETPDGAAATLDTILPQMAPADIILVEGWKAAPIPKIETRRQAQKERTPLHPADANVVAIAADHAVHDVTVPVFDQDEPAVILDFIVRLMGQHMSKSTPEPTQ